MKLTVKELYIDGVLMPTPALGGLTLTTNKLWSANTGRLEATGKMTGTITAIKHKVEIKWPPLSMEDAATIEAAVSSKTAFHSLKYTDQGGSTRTLTVYFGDISYTIHSYSEGVQRIENVTVSAIEQ